MPPAIIAGGIMAAGAIGGAVISSGAQKSAASQATQAQQTATDAQLQLGQQSLAQQNALAQQSMGLQRDVYNSNYDMLSPFVSRGNVAGESINALLGLPAAPAMHSPIAGSTQANQLSPPQSSPYPMQTGGFGGTAPLPGIGGAVIGQLNSQLPQQNPLAPPNTSTIQLQAQQAIAAGADPAAVRARMGQLGGQLQ